MNHADQQNMQIVSQPFGGHATLAPVVVRAGSNQSRDVLGVLFPGVQVEVKGVGRFVVLVSKVINDQQHHGNKGIFVVAERIETRTSLASQPYLHRAHLATRSHRQ